MRDSFIFYRSFYEAIRDLPRDIQSEIYTAIMEYSLYGNETDNLKPVARSIFTLIKPQIDINNTRYESGKKGGRAKTKQEPNDNQTITKQEPNDNQTITKQEPNDNQTITKQEPNVNVNDNVNKIPPNSPPFGIPVIIPIENFRDIVLNNDSRNEDCRRALKCDPEKLSDLITEFEIEQRAKGNGENTDKEYSRHFISWAKIRLENERKTEQPSRRMRKLT